MSDIPSNKSPVLLVLLDGFGYSNNPESNDYNAIKLANTPTWDKLWNSYPHSLLECSGQAVGLPEGQMGNSEVGHMNIGAGRVVYQNLTRIDQEIANSEFNNNKILLNLINNTKQNNNSLHICGLISDGGIHSHIDHIIALINLAKNHNVKNIYLHAFLDGRDTPPKSALKYLQNLNQIIKIASITGRYYAMDRDNRLERTELAYDLLTNNNISQNIDNNNNYIYSDIKTALEAAYKRNETDEFVKPTIIANNTEEYNDFAIKPNDNLIFMNFRADRTRQLSRLFVNKANLNQFVTLTEYEAGLTKYVAYKPASYNNMLSEYISKNNLTQLKIAETEKYAHVTFFLNGGIEEPFDKEDRVLIPSPKVATYDLKPEMSAPELTNKLTECITSGKYDAIVCNYANPDMVGHTGNLDATIKAIEVIDQSLAQLMMALDKVNGKMLVTADHGNAELMYDKNTKQAHTAHTSSLVPLVYYHKDLYDNMDLLKIANEHIDNKKYFSLIDIAPTMLDLMGLKIPKDMTGKIIF